MGTEWGNDERMGCGIRQRARRRMPVVWHPPNAALGEGHPTELGDNAAKAQRRKAESQEPQETEALRQVSRHVAPIGLYWSAVGL